NSPYSKHYTFVQTINQIPILNTQIKLNTSLNGKVTSILSSAITDKITRTVSITETPEFQSLETLFSNQISSKQWHYINGSLQLVTCIEGRDEKMHHHRVLLGSNGEVLGDINLNMNKGKDTTALAKVFLPDPLTSAQRNYGGDYVDNQDKDSEFLNNERKDVSIEVTFRNDSFILENEFVKMDNFGGPSLNPVISFDGTFYYTRAQSGFEDVMAYYHLNNFKTYIKLLGFDSLGDFQLRVDAHGDNQDNSFVNVVQGKPIMSLGTGGVDDGEDADVIVHEYGHALLYDAAPESNTGGERNSLDEAFGDYFAISYSRSYSNYNNTQVFSWDGHNEYWEGRSVSNNKKYPDNKNGSLYQDAAIWSATMIDIYNLLGKEKTDKMYIASVFGYTKNMSMQDAALLLLEAEMACFGGAHKALVAQALYNRGFDVPLSTSVALNDNNDQINLLNSETGELDLIELSLPSFTGSIRLTSLDGRTNKKVELKNVQTFKLNRFSPLPSGMYIFTVENASTLNTFKIVLN
ncbi:MAG: hypothetical protein ACJAZ3_001667, partial [Sphingobacteriales bacterium]